MKIAIVGSGIAGLGAAWALNQRHEITVFEAEGYLGGHANTVEVVDRGRQVPVDTGFIVYNELTYPKLTRLFRELEVPTEKSEMSFSASLGQGAFEYKGDLPGLLAQPSNLGRPRYWRMLRDILRFYREAPELLTQEAEEGPSLGAYLEAGHYSDDFVNDHLLPMGAAIWSTSLSDMRSFPARTFVQFCQNHGLLLLTNRPQWMTVKGGSREYVRRLSRSFRHRVRLNQAVVACRRTPLGVFVTTEAGGEERFDQLVLACHSDQALRILGPDATREEAETLGALGYEDNLAVLHRDPELMPRRRGAWASWNYLGGEVEARGRKVSVTYWMNRLQNLKTGEPLLLSLNPIRRPDPDKVLASYSYAHPQFDQAALEAQAALYRIQGTQRTWFCGAYCGYGFHEDGLEAGFKVAAELGAAVPWAEEAGTSSPAWRAVQPVLALEAAE